MVFRVLRPDANTVWKNEEILKRFSRYKGIIDNKEVARYLIAKSIECEFDDKAPTENLEQLLKDQTSIVQQRLTQKTNHF